MSLTLGKKKRLRRWLLAGSAVAVLVGGVVWVYQCRFTYYVTVRPGETVSIMVEVPMQRLLEHKNWAQDRGLPVRCVIRDDNRVDAVSISVLETGHQVHTMWARVRVSASDTAETGWRKRWSVDFAIAGQGGWPKAKIVAHVIE